MKIHHHNNGNFTAVSDKRDCVAEGETVMEAIINLGEMCYEKDKAAEVFQKEWRT